MADRRSFVSAISALGVWLARPEWLHAAGTVLRVDANPTVFFSHPDGARNLVRFEVSGIDAPAGRLRVFDRSRRLLGTAGVLRAGDRLYGELWMQVEGAISVVSELEAPGLRGPFRTTHRLLPERRWNIHFMTITDPDGVAETLNGLRPIHRAVQTALFRESSVTVNALPTSDHISTLEHVPFLRLGERAMAVERDFAIPMGTAAYLPNGVHLPKTGARALAGAGVRILAREQSDGDPFEMWEVPGGSRLLLVSLPAGSTPRSLGFNLDTNEMTRRVEGWLSSTALRFSQDDAYGSAVLLNSDVDETLPAALAAVSAWNSRFAFPHIVVGNADALFEEMEVRAIDTTITEAVSIHRPQMPEGTDLSAIAEARNSQGLERTHGLGRVLESVVGTGTAGLESVAACLATAVSGTLVFNPSPYQHSDLVCMSDGSERIATDVPGLGYAFFPDESVVGEARDWETVGRTYTAEGEQLRITVDRASGAISSLIQIVDGREWVRADSAGLNAIQGARLERLTVSRLSGVATRLVVSRQAPGVGAVTSTVTLYDELPWISLTNETDSTQPREIPYEFPFAVEDLKVSWEVPAGFEEAAVPVSLLEHLRWIRLEDRDATLMFRGFDAPLASVETDGTLTNHAPFGTSRYRLAPLSRFASQDMPWVFGWDTEPMVTARVEPNGTDILPRFGSIFTIEQVGITVLGIAPAADGIGVIAYLQETLGVSRNVSVAPGILRFEYAEVVDYVERYKEEIPLRSDGAIRVSMPASGVVAIRLSGLEPV